MDFFYEVDKVKKDFPKGKSTMKKVSKKGFNFYQLFSIWLLVIFILLGILFGNLFSTCRATSYYFSNNCINEFNFSLMLLIWFVGIIISIFIYGIGHIISLLETISEKLGKK